MALLLMSAYVYYLQEVFEMKYARMPEEAVQTDPTPPSSVASGLTRGEEGSGLSSTDDSSDDDSEEERERKLRDLQDQVNPAHVSRFVFVCLSVSTSRFVSVHSCWILMCVQLSVICCVL